MGARGEALTMATTDRETRRRALAESLMAEATRRYGADRAEALRANIDETASQLADVAVFPLDRDEGPSFNTDRPEAGEKK